MTVKEVKVDLKDGYHPSAIPMTKPMCQHDRYSVAADLYDVTLDQMMRRGFEIFI